MNIFENLNNQNEEFRANKSKVGIKALYQSGIHPV